MISSLKRNVTGRTGLVLLTLLPLIPGAIPAHADDNNTVGTGASIYAKASPAFVAVQYVWEREDRRQELTVAGIAISPDTVMVPVYAVPELIPDVQLKDFKIIVPKVDADHEELDATLLGRDDRYNVAYIKLKDSSKKLPATLSFSDKPPKVGQTVYSVGMLPKSAGYRTFLERGMVSVLQRGELRSIEVSGGLASGGGVVFDEAGDAIGIVQPTPRTVFFEANQNGQREDARFFLPSSEFLPSLQNIPADGKYGPYPFSGIMGLKGISKDVAEAFGLTGKPALEVGDIVPNMAAAKAGLEKGMIVIAVDGKLLERGDEPEELGPILSRTILRTKKPGDKITYTVITTKGAAPKDIEITLGERPARPNTMPRFYAEDLGYTVRDATFYDRYGRKLPEDAKGVVVDFIKENSTAATARLKPRDMITQLNGTEVTDVANFKTAYESFRKEKPKDALVLQVLREGNTQIIRVEPPQ
jgi:S1-C subfamily serine protease